MVGASRRQPHQFLRRVPNRPTLRRRNRLHAMIRVAIVVGGLAVGGLGAGAAYERALTHPALALRRVVLQGVSGPLEPAVQARLAPYRGRNLLALDLEQVKERLEGIPEVRRATVRRLLPDGLQVGVEVRTSRALLVAGEGRYVLDEEGVVISTGKEEGAAIPTGRTGTLPRLILDPAAGLHALPDPQFAFQPGQRLTLLPGHGETISSALAVLDWLERRAVALPRPIRHLRLGPAGVVLVLADPPLEVVVGDGQAIEDKIAALRTLLQTNPPRGPATVDLRFRDMLVVRPLSPEEEA